jgi:hypothetical protein
VAFVVPRNDFTEAVLARAEEIDVPDRVHVLPYVPQDQVVPFLSDATAGVIPIHHFPNHEIALITKYFEYAHARLPIIVSDVETMARQTRDLGNGEVFVADDVPDYVRAVRAVLADRSRYVAVYDERPEVLQTWSWQRQAAILTDIYTAVTGLRPEARPELPVSAAPVAETAPAPGAGAVSPVTTEPVSDDDVPAGEPLDEREAEPEGAAGGPL